MEKLEFRLYNHFKIPSKDLIVGKCPLDDYTPAHIHVSYKTHNARMGHIVIVHNELENDDLEEFAPETYAMSTENMGKYFSHACYMEALHNNGEPTELLNKLNQVEYNRLNQYINELQINLKEKTTEVVTSQVMHERINELTVFKKLFLKWFIDRKIPIPNDSKNEGTGNIVSLSPLDLGDLTKKNMVEQYVVHARNDTQVNAHLQWKIRFFDDVGKKSLYPTIGRVRKEFKEKHPEEIFNINGMAWYHQP